MQTRIFQIDSQHPDAGLIAKAADVLRCGRLVAFPTETVYGLGANARSGEAVRRIFEAKGRPVQNPIIVHVGNVEAAKEIVADWPALAQQLAERFWPGPLTLVLPRDANVPDVVTAGGPTVAVRIPAHPVALALIRAAALPVAAPSANRSGYLSPTRAEHVLRGLGGGIDLILDGGPTPGGVESTVLDLTHAPARVLRPGLVSVADIEDVIGRVETGELPETAGPLPSPGLLVRHYAPLTPLECLTDDQRRVIDLTRQGRRIGWLTFADRGSIAGVVRIDLPADPVGYAAGLYDALHRLDQQQLERIIVSAPPETPEWLAVHDRLRRAAHSS